MRPLPLVSLAVAVTFLAVAWRRRGEFSARPYLHFFLYLHLAAAGLHQFEEYGWPGGFRDVFAGLFGAPGAAPVPSRLSLEALNVFGLLPAFGLAGWLGTRIRWIGIALLSVSFANGFFHLVASVTRWAYVPGAATGSLLYLPLWVVATRHAVARDDVDAPRLLLAFGLGTALSFAPFLHVRLLQVVHP